MTRKNIVEAHVLAGYLMIPAQVLYNVVRIQGV